MKIISKIATTQLISAVFIFLFTYTAVNKLSDIADFRFTLQQMPFISRSAHILAIGLPVLELLVSALLFFKVSRVAGIYGALALMSCFTGFIAYMLVTSQSLPCSCGGVLRHLSWKQHLWFNIFFTVLAMAGLYFERYSQARGDRRYA